MGFSPKKNVFTPLDPTDHPKLDETDLLDLPGKKNYWSLMGMLQWAVTLGRIDIAMAVSTMGSFRVEPRQGHLERLTRIFRHLKNYMDLSV